MAINNTYVLPIKQSPATIVDTIFFDLADPNTVGNVFVPNTQQTEQRIYVSKTNGTTWIWDSVTGQYVTQSAPLKDTVRGNFGSITTSTDLVTTTAGIFKPNVAAEFLGTQVSADIAKGALLLKAGYLYRVDVTFFATFAAATNNFRTAFYTSKDGGVTWKSLIFSSILTNPQNSTSLTQSQTRNWWHIACPQDTYIGYGTISISGTAPTINRMFLEAYVLQATTAQEYEPFIQTAIGYINNASGANIQTWTADNQNIATNYAISTNSMIGCLSGYNINYSGVFSGASQLIIAGLADSLGSFNGGGSVTLTGANTNTGATIVSTSATLNMGADTTSVDGRLGNSSMTVQSGAIVNMNNIGLAYPGRTMFANLNNTGVINVRSSTTTLPISITNGTTTNNAAGVINLLFGSATIDSGITNDGIINLAAGTVTTVSSNTLYGSGDIVSAGGVIKALGSGSNFSFNSFAQKLITNGNTNFGYVDGIPSTSPVFNWYQSMEVNAPLNVYGANVASGIFSDWRCNSNGSTFAGSGDINLIQGYVCFATHGTATAANTTYNGTVNVKSGSRLDLRNFAGAGAVGRDMLINATVNIEGGTVNVVNSNEVYTIKSLRCTTSGSLGLTSIGMQLRNQDPTPVKAVISSVAPIAIIAGTLNTEAVNTMTGNTIVGLGGAGIGGGFATTGKVAALTMGGANSRLVVNPITASTASKLTCTNFSATANAYKVDITGVLNTGVYTILTATGSKNLNLPTIGSNLSGKTASFAWSGNNLNMTLV